jgi:hypothetical protein
MNECCPHEVQINTSANKIKVQYIPGTAHSSQLTERQKRQKGGKVERAKQQQLSNRNRTKRGQAQTKGSHIIILPQCKNKKYCTFDPVTLFCKLQVCGGLL